MKTNVLYVGLINEDGKEIKGKGYKRQKITKWKLDWLNECFMVDEKINFPQAKTSWGVIERAKLFSQARGGRIIRTFDLSKKRFVAINDVPQFIVGDLEWSLA